MSAVHHALIDAGERMHASIILESGEPREVHHFAALIGYGANSINPWLAFRAIEGMVTEGGRQAAGIDVETARKNFTKAVEKGILKVMSKMGIATLDAYCGAQIFEALGVSEELLHECFAGTDNFRLGGVSYDDLARDVLQWHRNGFPKSNGTIHQPVMDSYGFYKGRRGGEQHAFSPEVVERAACRGRTGQGRGARRRVRAICEAGRGPASRRVARSPRTEHRGPEPASAGRRWSRLRRSCGASRRLPCRTAR